MSKRIPIPLIPVIAAVDGAGFKAVLEWPFADSFVGRLLRTDIPQRVITGDCQIWTYVDPDGQVVGFGTLDVCGDYRDKTGGLPHPYIPLLAVNPSVKSMGYGTSIVRHLIEEAATLFLRRGDCHDGLFLDVYTANTRAIAVYSSCGFTAITDEEFPDAQEGGQNYVVMALKLFPEVI